MGQLYYRLGHENLLVAVIQIQPYIFERKEPKWKFDPISESKTVNVTESHSPYISLTYTHAYTLTCRKKNISLFTITVSQPLTYLHFKINDFLLSQRIYRGMQYFHPFFVFYKCNFFCNATFLSTIFFFICSIFTLMKRSRNISRILIHVQQDPTKNARLHCLPFSNCIFQRSYKRII